MHQDGGTAAGGCVPVGAFPGGGGKNNGRYACEQVSKRSGRRTFAGSSEKLTTMTESTVTTLSQCLSRQPWAETCSSIEAELTGHPHLKYARSARRSFLLRSLCQPVL